MATKLTFKDVPIGDGAIVPSREEINDLFLRMSDVLGSLRRSDEPACGVALIDELETRLEQLRVRYDEAIRLNDECIAAGPKLPWFDPSREAFVHEVDGQIVELLKLNRSDPNTPINVQEVFQGTGFVPGSKSSPEHSALPSSETEKKLSAELEDFYYAASRFWDLVEQQYLGKGKSSFIGVKMVRNRLLEHAEKGATNSFGATNRHGPLVKPMRDAEAKKEPFDRGLLLNLHELLQKSVERLSN